MQDLVTASEIIQRLFRERYDFATTTQGHVSDVKLSVIETKSLLSIIHELTKEVAELRRIVNDLNNPHLQAGYD